MTRPVHPATFGWCMDPSHRRGDCTCPCHTPADPGADECAADDAGEWLADLAQSGDTDFNTQTHERHDR